MFNIILFTENKSNVEARGVKAFKDIMAKLSPSIEADAVEAQPPAVKSAAAKPTKRKSTTPKARTRNSSTPKSTAIKPTLAKSSSSSSSQTGSSSESDDTISSPVTKRRKQIEKDILGEAGSPEGCQCEQLKIELDKSKKKLAALQEKNQDGKSKFPNV